MIAWGLGVFVYSTASADNGTFWTNFFDRDLKVVTVTDFTEIGRKLPQASKEHPVYFEALILGYKDWGKRIAGEKIPDKKFMIRVILKVLADQGYYPCTKLHKPTLMLALAWGSMNQAVGTSLPFLGGDKLDLLWAVESNPRGMINPRMATLFMRSQAENFIMDAAQGNLYVASIQAFDEAAALEGKTRLMWHTKISCPADGLDMDTALTRIIHLAGPNIGHETLKPLILEAPQKTAHVDIGEMKVLETIDTAKLPITDLTEPAAPEAKTK